jgi:hypothetical protein
LVSAQSDGTFVLMKTNAGSKPVIKLFKVPASTEDLQDDYE